MSAQPDMPPETPPDVPRAEPEGVAGERGIPQLQRIRSVQSRVSSFLTVGLTSALAAGLLLWYYHGALQRPDRAREQAAAALKRRAQGDVALPPLGPLPAREVKPDDSLIGNVLGDPPPLNAPEIPVAQRSSSPYANLTAKTPGELAWERKMAGPVLIPMNGSRSGSESARYSTTLATPTFAGGPAMEMPAMNGGAGVGSGPELGDLLRPTATPAVRAQVLPTQALLLPKGAFIDCTLETAISSSLPGMTTCITATDTFSADGAVVLLERGTKLVGETRGQVQQGSPRLFVLWTEARSPTGVVVPLASPGTDELGRSGLSGHIERHWWTRFGSAILVSIINGAVQAASQQGRDGTLIVNPTTGGDVMTEVLKDTIHIPPTIEKPSGDKIQVLVARDVDFRSVYQLKAAP